jgi:hypothetical protein
LLISTLLARKASQIYEVVEKRDTIITMFLDWLCNIFDFIIDFSPSLQDGVQSKDGLVYDVGVIGLEQLELGVSCIGIDALSIKL